MEHKLVPYFAVTEIDASSVLVLAPHPDDEVFGCGGAILRHVELGAPVRVSVITDGALGYEGEARRSHAARRQEESRAAARILGYGSPEFWNLPDQGIAYGEELISRIGRSLDGADVVYAPSILEIHPDHRAAGMAAAEAVRRAGGGRRIAFYEVGAPLRPNLLLDISRFADRKAAAARCFASQLERQGYHEHVAALNRYRTYTLSPEVTAAEAFVVATAEALKEDPLGIYRSEYARQDGLGLSPDSRSARLVSVLVRSMDRPTLADALDSVALQTYPNIEVVVVDARGRHAPLPETCGRFPMRLVSAGAPLARSAAANQALDAARGDLAIFLDDDDLFFPDHVARLAEALRREPHAKAAYAGVRVESDGAVIDTYDEALPSARQMAWNHLPIHAVLFERGLIEEGCRFDEGRDHYEDWDFWLQVQARTRLARAPGVSAIYRAHLGQSASVSAERLRDERLGLWAKWVERWTPEAMECLATELKAYRAKAAEADTLREVLAVERDKVSELTWELARCNERVAAQVEEFAALRASTSWRITAPVRGAAGLARKLGAVARGGR